ncbi:MAG: hypothetical protein IH845_03590 [Nanoarchaeota archaeon]|nr:hypothetical protein [Nanoarchaeota archaeon]
MSIKYERHKSLKNNGDRYYTISSVAPLRMHYDPLGAFSARALYFSNRHSEANTNYGSSFRLKPVKPYSGKTDEDGKKYAFGNPGSKV